MTCICIIHNGERYHHPNCTSFHTVKAVGYSNPDGTQLFAGPWYKGKRIYTFGAGKPIYNFGNCDIPRNNFHAVVQTNGVIEDPTPIYDPINPNLPHWRRKKTAPSEDKCENCGAPRTDSPDNICIYCKQPLPKDMGQIILEAAKML